MGSYTVSFSSTSLPSGTAEFGFLEWSDGRHWVRSPIVFTWIVLVYVWPSLVSSLPNPPSIRLLFLFCPFPRLTASWGHVWRPWLISTWWRIWEERNNRVLRDTFSSPDSVARIVQGDVQFAIPLKRRRPSAAR
ncbi:hypothetical protein EJ110_NYTH22285 [Nymphaea thermarum]|nr:hypothetical protein EJ110_NYTH22285 [Nymphaea thermarum]